MRRGHRHRPGGRGDRAGRALPSLLLAAVLQVAACAEEPIGPTAPGRLVISTLTQGNDPDLDGYELAIDGGEPVTLLSNDADTLILGPGRHTMVLRGVAEHCAVDPGPFLDAEVVSGRTRTLALEIACPLTRVQVSVSTTGTSLDADGYLLAVDGINRGTIDPTGSALLTRLAPGARSVSLNGLEANCTPDERSRSVTVAADQVVGVEFAVSCVAPVGTVRVAAPTTGPARGPYQVFLVYDYDVWGFDDGFIELGSLPANGRLSTQAAAGRYWVELGVDPNCSVSGPNPTGPFILRHGSTVDLVFPVFCSDGIW